MKGAKIELIANQDIWLHAGPARNDALVYGRERGISEYEDLLAIADVKICEHWASFENKCHKKL